MNIYRALDALLQYKGASCPGLVSSQARGWWEGDHCRGKQAMAVMLRRRLVFTSHTLGSTSDPSAPRSLGVLGCIPLPTVK